MRVFAEARPCRAGFEIAAILGMAEKAVSVHLHRARHQLIAQLGRTTPSR
jgi:DNA-directed RNA polymerase specialized sigma24 family protein